MCYNRPAPGSLCWESPSDPQPGYANKALIGHRSRPGTRYTQGVVGTLDHDFPSLAHGAIIPQGIDDLKKHSGSINWGRSRDTREVACDSVRQWWQAQGQAASPHASSRLRLCDGGGSKGARPSLVQAARERFAQETGLAVRWAPSPVDTSQDNPLAHRLFPHLPHACQGVICTSVEGVKELMEKATTKPGLHVSGHRLAKVDTSGRNVPADFKEQRRGIVDEDLPSWHSRALPEAAYTGEVISFLLLNALVQAVHPAGVRLKHWGLLAVQERIHCT